MQPRRSSRRAAAVDYALLGGVSRAAQPELLRAEEAEDASKKPRARAGKQAKLAKRKPVEEEEEEEEKKNKKDDEGEKAEPAVAAKGLMEAPAAVAQRGAKRARKAAKVAAEPEPCESKAEQPVAADAALAAPTTMTSSLAKTTTTTTTTTASLPLELIAVDWEGALDESRFVLPYAVDPQDRSVTLGTAKSSFGLSDSDLRDVMYRAVPNPHYRSAAPMRLYSVSTLVPIANAKAKAKWIKAESAYLERMQKLAKKLASKGLSLQRLLSLPLMKKHRDLVMGDFIAPRKESKPNTTITQAFKRLLAVELVTRLLPQSYHRVSLVGPFLKVKYEKIKTSKDAWMVLDRLLWYRNLFAQVVTPLVAHKLVAFMDGATIKSFALAFPGWGLEREFFVYTSSPEDQAAARQALINEVLNRCPAARSPQGDLVKRLQADGNLNASFGMLLKTALANPSCPYADKRFAADAFIYILTTTEQQRTAALAAHFNGVLNNPCAVANRFIVGAEGRCLDEVVAIQRFFARTSHMAIYSRKFALDKMEALLHERVYEHNMSWNAASDILQSMPMEAFLVGQRQPRIRYHPHFLMGFLGGFGGFHDDEDMPSDDDGDGREFW